MKFDMSWDEALGRGPLDLEAKGAIVKNMIRDMKDLGVTLRLAKRIRESKDLNKKDRCIAEGCVLMCLQLIDMEMGAS